MSFQPQPGAENPWSVAPVAPKNGFGVSALVCAIAGLILIWTAVGGILLGVLAAVLGFIGLNRVKSGQATNRGVAIAAIIVSVFAITGGGLFLWSYASLSRESVELIECKFLAGDDHAARQECDRQFVDELK